MNNNSSKLAVVGLLFAMLIWGSSFIAMKIAFRAYDPMLVVFGRLAIASLLFLLLLPRLRGVRVLRKDIGLLTLMALFEPCLYFIFEAMALQYTTASQAGMVTAMLPLIVALVAGWWLGETISSRSYAGFLLAVAGTWWLSVGGESSEGAPNPLLGNFLEFIAMLCAAGYTVTLKRLTSRYSPLFLTAIQAWIGTLFFAPTLIWSQVPASPDGVLEPSLALLYLGSFVSIGAYGLYNYGVSRVPASQAGAFINLIPVFSVLLGFTMLGESFSLQQFIAALLVFLGLLLSYLGRHRELPTPVTESAGGSA